VRSLRALLWTGALGLALLFPALAASAEIKPWSGPATLPLVLQGIDGRKVDLAALRGRVVLINFWATWCEPCRDEMPSLERLRTRLQGRPFELVTVNFGESGASVVRFLGKLRLSLPVLLDPEKKAAEEWKVRGLPMTFLVDARGTVRFWTFGEHDWSEGAALQAVETLVAEAGRGRG
jgi:cytochrome c biogenesis protein CcmG, thiol:disulfide interchange protein DsbE